ncbi:acyl-CoA dehydrogenase family protein [Sphingomonas elodea]|uniref:acyl-CoA dehydrogenase family protein n=1 Tax=Sphingomonas elodea TaxID=179878 RepID=UPI0002630D12|nr:acyl-CoA dehydrogenase family protein [Sphingomonas elodea]
MIDFHAHARQSQQRPDAPPEYEALAARFRPIFARIAETAAERESERRLPFEEIEALTNAGFGAIRVPVQYGGAGATITQVFRLLAELGAADSNIVQALRAHFAFVESRLNEEDQTGNAIWFERIASGQLIGAAMAERTTATETLVALTPDGNGWRLNGEKFYCTGTLYADWIHVAAAHGEDRLGVIVPATADGVTRIDDWDGFGQRMTASGTTRFDQVRVESDQVIRRWARGEFRPDTYITAFFQQFHLAAFSGIGRAILNDTVAFVRAKTRTFGVPGTADVAADPLVQRVVGRVSALSFGLDAILENVSLALEVAHAAWLAGNRGDEGVFLAADIAAYRGQLLAIDLVLQASSLFFEVGGASATQEHRRLDRHWRNARVIASHNPAIQRERALGEYFLLGTSPRKAWADRFAATSSDGEKAPVLATEEATHG